ncbi:MAG: hypothetical protein SNJ50_17465, partial [Cyanobacteriota bacterium]
MSLIQSCKETEHPQKTAQDDGRRAAPASTMTAKSNKKVSEILSGFPFVFSLLPFEGQLNL